MSLLLHRRWVMSYLETLCFIDDDSSYKKFKTPTVLKKELLQNMSWTDMPVASNKHKYIHVNNLIIHKLILNLRKCFDSSSYMYMLWQLQHPELTLTQLRHILKSQHTPENHRGVSQNEPPWGCRSDMPKCVVQALQNYDSS